MALRKMKRQITVFLIIASIQVGHLLAAGKIYWQANGVLATGSNGLGIGDLVDDMRGGAYVITGDLDSVYIVRVDRDGNLPWSAMGKVVDNDGTLGLVYHTQGASDGRGGAIVVWARQYFDGDQLYYQRIDSLGNRCWNGGACQRLTASDSFQTDHIITSDNQKGAIIAWRESRNGQYDIYAQRVDSNGTKRWFAYGKTVCNAQGDQSFFNAMTDNQEYFIITWEDGRNGLLDIFAQKIDGDGNFVWPENGQAICLQDSIQSRPSLGLANNKIIIAWNDKRNGNMDIFAQCLNIDGTANWLENGISICTVQGTQGASKSIMDELKRSFMVWWDNRSGNWDIYCIKVDSLGTAVWPETSICNADSDQHYAEVVSDGSYGAIICWQDYRSGNNDIYVQHVDAAGNNLWGMNGMVVCNANGTQERPRIIQSDSNRAIIAWPDGRTGSWRGYVQKVGDDGSGVSSSPLPTKSWGVRLLQNHPNPFHWKTTIEYQMPGPGNVNLDVYNITGQLVKTLVSGRQEPGYYSINWDGKDNQGKQVANGVYLYRLIAGSFTGTKKMVVLR